MIVAVELGERFKDKTVCFVGAFSYRFQEQVSDLIIKEQGTMLLLAKRWPSGALRPNSANVDIKGTKLKPAALAKLCNLAWAESCGMPDDASAEHHRQDGSKNQRKNQRTMLLDDLRGGLNGVARWNDRSQNQRTATGPFRGLDFGGVDLESAELSDCDFRGSSFKGANLRYARLYFTDLKKVCFQGACLAGATCIQMKASEADFQMPISPAPACAGQTSRTQSLRTPNLSEPTLKIVMFAALIYLRACNWNQRSYRVHNLITRLVFL